MKYKSQTMYGGSKAAGDYYYLPNVPSVMYFYRDYALHGTYWHKNFAPEPAFALGPAFRVRVRRPMSRGCVNLTLADAELFFSWAPLGTPVVTHYWFRTLSDFPQIGAPGVYGKFFVAVAI